MHQVYPDTEEVLSLLLKRSSILSVIYTSPSTPRDITDKTDISRSTVGRALLELEEFKLIRDEHGQYQMTTSGKILWDKYKSFIKFIYDVSNKSEVFNNLPDGVLNNIPLNLFVDARIIHSSTQTPLGAIRDLSSRILESEDMSAILPVILPIDIELYLDKIATEQMDVDILVNNVSHAHLLDKCSSVKSDSVNISKYSTQPTSQQISFCLYILDHSEVWVRFHDERGNVINTFLNKSIKAVEWANKLFNRYKPELSE
ncbi:transcriptional regulator FilR1 domain-containing protein [Haladaptatus paucihalophilus]|uniref:Predicted transcriptional regulator, contains HTH domain n=1 Tax=Haladaptatus paucihalophilus DX253 TaxID=797209 RepID=A0A1M6W4H9_HALPU|nr:hypothetical protein [Haladaptatus paucihalophilus]SHK88664.1 Predicted transcriptional regulator, contains HTH domain [Haladaptatus paucihalophilus DX253]